MLKFIKNIFSRKQEPKEPEKADVSLNELESWFSSRVDQKFEVLNKRIASVFEEVKTNKERVKDRLEILTNAKLANQNISTRELQIMEGNKITYMRKVELFINRLDAPENISFDSSNEFCNNFQEYLNELNKNTQKPFFVLKHFFDNEVEAIAREINNLSQTVNNLKKNISEDEEINKVLEVKKAIKEISDRHEASKRLTKSIEEEEANRQNIANDIEEIESKAAKIRENEEFQKLTELKNEKIKLESELTSAKLGISGIFAPLEKPFRKFKNLRRDDTLLDKYINDPINALLEDNDFKIIKILEEMKTQLDQLDLDDKRKEKAMAAIGEISREKLLGLRKRYSDAKNGFDANERKIKINYANTHLNDMGYRLDFFKKKLEKVDENLNILRQKLEKIKEMVRVEPLQEKLKEITNVDVRIIV